MTQLIQNLDSLNKAIFNNKKHATFKDLKFLALSGGRNNEASSYLLFIDGYRILLDAGISVTKELDIEVLYEYPPDLILISHAHIDHVGFLNQVHIEFPHVPIYMTEPTFELSKIILNNIAEINARKKQIKDSETSDQALESCNTIDFGVSFHFKELKITFQMAGHILGAAYILIEGKSTVLYTGDLSSADRYSVKAHYKEKFPNSVDLLISESTFGDKHNVSRRTELDLLVTSITKTLTRGGRVLFPAPSLGGCEEILLLVLNAMNENIIPKVPVYYDGLAREFLPIYRKYHELTNSINLIELLDNENLFIIEDFEHRNKVAYNYKKPSIIISPSSLLVGGPSVLYGKEILSEELSSIIFIGVKAIDTPAFEILESKINDEIDFSSQGLDNIIRKCDVYHHSLAIHCDQAEIISFLNTFRPEVVLLVHGTFKAKINLFNKTHGFVLNNIFARIPANDELIDVDFSRKLSFLIKSLGPYTESNNYLFQSFVDSLLLETEITDEVFISKLIDQHIITKLTSPQIFVRFSTNLYLRSVVFVETPPFELGVSILEHMSRLCRWIFGQSSVSMIRTNLRYMIVTLLKNYIITGKIQNFSGNKKFYNIEIQSLNDLSNIIALINENIPEDLMERVSIDEIKTYIDDDLKQGQELGDKNLYSIFDEQKKSESKIEKIEPDTPRLLETTLPMESDELYRHLTNEKIPIIQDITHFGTVTCYKCGTKDIMQESSIRLIENEYHSLITCNICDIKFYLKSSNRK